MFKKALLAAAVVVASSPAFVSAQDFFFSFDENSRVSSTTIDPTTTSTGSVFLFSDGSFDFNQSDLPFALTNSGVVDVTGGVVFNPGSANSGIAASASGGAFTSFDLDQVSPGTGRIFATSFLSPGQVPGSNASNFRAGADAFLLAQVDFDVVGPGTTDFEFSVGALGVVNDGVGPVDVNLEGGAGSVTVVEAIPEPSSAVLLMLGVAGMAARRRRS